MITFYIIYLEKITGLLGALGGQVGGQLGGIAQTQLGISQGEDPRFAKFAAGQRGLLNAQRGNAFSAASGRLARSGVRGTAAQNELNRLGATFDPRELALTGDIGMAQLRRQDTARSSAAGLFGQRGRFLAGITGQQAGLVGQQTGIVGQQAGLTGQQASLAGAGFQAEQAGITSQNTALRGRLEGIQTGLQNMLAAPTLRTAQLAANKSGGGGGKK